MWGNYLGLSSNRSRDSASSSGGCGGSGRGGPARYGKPAPAPPSTRCQKCNQLGHYTYECTNAREYKVRPSRTQILNNPKLRTKLTESVMPRQEEVPKEGTAAAILAANEAKRAAKAQAAKLLAADADKDRGRSSRRRGRSASVEEQVARASSPRALRLGLLFSLAFAQPLALAGVQAPRPFAHPLRRLSL
ncbi:hypothetical protein JCM10207_006189 [Rhodosporidiobolus poonsookiae]